MSLETCFLGGNVAENAGGGKAVKYGVTSRYVTGLEVVLASGEVLRLGGKLRKDVTGYDLIHLLAGSEGTLAVITEITLSLLPVPRRRAVLLASFPSVSAAIGAVPLIIRKARILPTSVEYMNRPAAHLFRRPAKKSLRDGIDLLHDAIGVHDDDAIGHRMEDIVETVVEQQ